MANGNKDRHPNTDFNATIQRGLKALDLARKHQAALEPRLRAGTLDGLTADLERLGADVPGALVTRSAAKTATKTQNDWNTWPSLPPISLIPINGPLISEKGNDHAMHAL